MKTIYSIILILLFTPLAHAENKLITSAIFAEQDNPKASRALLNTYYNLGKGDVLKGIKGHSSAYRLKSKRYKLAYSGNMNKTDLQTFQKIYNIVENFKPEKNWPYIKHESPHFYKGYADMVNKLKKKWGNEVEYDTAKLIEGQYYFKRREK